MLAADTVGFTIGQYDKTAALIIDPEILYCGYIGGSGDDGGDVIAVDSSGAVYVTGDTQSTKTLSRTPVGPATTYNGNYDAFVAKISADGKSLIYCGYIGGTSDEFSTGIAVDSSGAAYVTGHTWSDGGSFPVVGGPNLAYNGGRDAFVAKISADGKSLIYCGYIGGTGNDYTYGIAVDSSGAAYVTGYTTPPMTKTSRSPAGRTRNTTAGRTTPLRPRWRPMGRPWPTAATSAAITMTTVAASPWIPQARPM